MTAQVPDRLVLRGEEYALCATPLEDYLKRVRKARRPAFMWSSTACYRGYVARWEVKARKLYLTALEGWIERDNAPISGGLRDAFPRLKTPLFASWVTDTLRCPEGRLLSYVHAGFASTYERDRLIHFEKGVLVSEWLRLNPPEPIWYRISVRGKRTRYEDPHPDADKLEDLYQPDETPSGHRYWGQSPKEGEQEGYLVGGALTMSPRRRDW